MAHYERVIPRDLFNESKLLKCMGQLILKIGNDPDVSKCLSVNEIENYYEDGFDIEQDQSEGSIYIGNISIYLTRKFFLVTQWKPIRFYTPLNSKDNWPLLCTIDETEVTVFNSLGDFSMAFLGAIGDR